MLRLLFRLLVFDFLLLLFASESDGGGGGVLPLIKLTPLLNKFDTELINPDDALPEDALPSDGRFLSFLLLPLECPPPL